MHGFDEWIDSCNKWTCSYDKWIHSCNKWMYGLTSSLINTGSTPKNGIMGKPGLGVESLGAGRGVIIIPPVSSVKYHIMFS